MNLLALIKRVLAIALILAAPGIGAQEGLGDVVYVPTPQEVVDEMLNMAKVGPNDYLIDRENQRNATFSGVRGLAEQDAMIQYSQGRIAEARVMLRPAFGPRAGNSTLSKKTFEK